MNAYFFLELDTTGPQIALFTPDYTGRDYCPVRVEGNELLDPTLELYVIDSKGIRQNATIAYYGTYFEGFIPFHNVAPGIANIYARARDTVFNLSNSVQKAVLVFGEDEVTGLEIETSEIPFLISAISKVPEIDLQEIIGDIDLQSLGIGGKTIVVVSSTTLLRRVAEIEARSDFMQYQFGNTVKLEAFFKDFDGNPVDPSNIKLIVYDSKFGVVSSITITSENRVELGHYYYLYTLPAGTNPKTIYYEWYAEIQGSPTVKRESLKLVFI